MGRWTHVFFTVGWYPDAELFCYDDMKNVVSFSYGDTGDIESLKSQQKIKWLVSTLGSDGKMRISVLALTRSSLLQHLSILHIPMN